MNLRSLATSFSLVVWATIQTAKAEHHHHHHHSEERCQSIAEIACGSDDFSTLCAAVQAAGLAETLDHPSHYGPFTVFAPNEDAFGALPAGTVEALLDDIPALKDILLFHVVHGQHYYPLYAQDLHCTELTKMMNGNDSRTVCRGDKIFQKGAGNDDSNMMPEIIATDIEACNGVVHVVSQVMLPP